MSEIGDIIQGKCLAFGDRVIKLNDYLLEQAANTKPHYTIIKGKRVYEKPIPVYLQAVSNLCNQLLRAGTSIGANNAEATNAISDTDYRSKSFIALKEARESLYWIQLLHRNGATLTINSLKAYTVTAKNWSRYSSLDAKKMNEAINAKGKK